MKNNNIGRKIYLLRTSKRMDRATLSNLIDISERTIRRWETGKSKIRESNLLKICDVFNKNIIYFKDEDDTNE